MWVAAYLVRKIKEISFFVPEMGTHGRTSEESLVILEATSTQDSRSAMPEN
jgi:hypothetical protein